MKNISICFFLFFINIGFSQDESLVKLRYWNGEIKGAGIKNPVGLMVSASEKRIANSIEEVYVATLADKEEYYFKNKFALFFTVQNVSNHDVAIYDWAFKAVCPVDNMGRVFDANSTIQLITPYIPSSIFIILKPGEKLQFYSAVSDFFWCTPKDYDDLLLEPHYFQALITCAAIFNSGAKPALNKTIGKYTPPINPPKLKGDEIDATIVKLINLHNTYVKNKEKDKAESLEQRIKKIMLKTFPNQTALVTSKLLKDNSKDSVKNDSQKSKEDTIELDPQLEELIRSYKQAVSLSDTNEASKIKAEILDMANHAYPDKIEEIKKLIAVPEKKITAKENNNPPKTSKPVSESFSEWKFLQSDKAVQVRYQEIKKEGNTSYFKVQFRINFNDEIFCASENCLGYLFVYGYPTSDGKDYIENSYKFYKTFKEIYTLPNLIPIQMSFSDGSKRVFNKNGFFYINKDNVEMPIQYLFSVCVDEMLKNNPSYHRCNRFTLFKENEAIIIQ